MTIDFIYFPPIHVKLISMTSRARLTSSSIEKSKHYYKTVCTDKSKMGTPDDEKFDGKRKPRFRSGINHHQQRVAATTIVLLTIMVLTSMITTPHNQISPAILRGGASDIYTELISNSVLPNTSGESSDGNDFQNIFRDFGTCVVTPAVAPDHAIQSTFTASYPGSGAKMTWNLIEALSGFVTGDDFQLNGHANIVSIKTHYPSHEGREIPDAHLIQRAILLVRHPINAIPSYFNYLYEMENHLENHSTRAPLEAWKQWRDNNFDRQLQVWRRHTEHWMDMYSKSNRLVIGYERLTDDNAGPGEAMRLGEFLSRSAGVTIHPPGEVPCIWYTVVKYKKGKTRRLQEVPVTSSNEVEAAQNQGPPSTAQQDPLVSKSTNPPLANVVDLSENEQNIDSNVPGTAGVQTRSWEGVPKLLQEFVADQKKQKQAAQNLLQNMEVRSSVEAQPIQQEFHAPSFLQASTQQNSQVPSLQQKIAQPVQQEVELVPEIQLQQSQAANTLMQQQQPIQGPQSAHHTEPQQPSNSQGAQTVHPAQPQEAELNNLISDPSKPHSKRGGPKYIAPYTPSHLKDMIQVLTNLLERYRDDRALAPILVEYIDVVARRSEGPPEDANTVIEEDG